LLDYEVVGKLILYRVTYYDKLPMGTWLAVTRRGEQERWRKSQTFGAVLHSRRRELPQCIRWWRNQA